MNTDVIEYISRENIDGELVITALGMIGDFVVYKRVEEHSPPFIHVCWFNSLDNKHRVDKPAEIWYENEKIIEERWYYNGYLHNKKAPAITQYGKEKVCIYAKNGEVHNKRGPATIRYRQDGTAYGVGYFLRGVEHNLDDFRTKTRSPSVGVALRQLPLPIADDIWHYYCQF
jgi:hypothetical protein